MDIRAPNAWEMALSANAVQLRGGLYFSKSRFRTRLRGTSPTWRLLADVDCFRMADAPITGPPALPGHRFQLLQQNVVATGHPRVLR